MFIVSNYNNMILLAIIKIYSFLFVTHKQSTFIPFLLLYLRRIKRKVFLYKIRTILIYIYIYIPNISIEMCILIIKL